MTFREEMIKLISENVPTIVIVGEVVSVDEDKRSCTVKDTDTELELYDVKLQGSLGLTEGLLITPKVGSKVLVSLIGNEERNLFIVQYSEVEKIELKGSEFGGLIKIEELKKELNKNTARIDAIIDILKNTIPSCSLYPNGAWAGIIAPLVATLQKESYTDIENKEVTHG